MAEEDKAESSPIEETQTLVEDEIQQAKLLDLPVELVQYRDGLLTFEELSPEHQEIVSKWKEAEEEKFERMTEQELLAGLEAMLELPSKTIPDGESQPITDFNVQSIVEAYTDDASLRVELDQNADRILNILTDIKRTASEHNRQRLLNLIAEMFKLDFVEESDILKSIIEASESKKLLSALFHKLGVEASSTRIYQDGRISTYNIDFNPKMEYSIEDYKKGTIQAILNIEHINERTGQITELEGRIKELETTLDRERSKTNKLELALNAEKEIKVAARKIHAIVPLQYALGWTNEGKQYFFRVKENEKSDTKGVFATKYLMKTKFFSKAKRFTDREIAEAQLERIKKHEHNLDFKINEKELAMYHIAVEDVRQVR